MGNESSDCSALVYYFLSLTTIRATRLEPPGAGGRTRHCLSDHDPQTYEWQTLNLPSTTETQSVGIARATNGDVTPGEKFCEILRQISSRREKSPSRRKQGLE